jgi:hypothetical protein
VKEDGIYYAKDCAVCADAQREREDSDKSKSRRFSKETAPKAQILQKVICPPPHALFAGDFLNLLDTAKLFERRAPRLVRRHASGQITLGQAIEMLLNLLCHLGIAFPLLKET